MCSSFGVLFCFVVVYVCVHQSLFTSNLKLIPLGTMSQNLEKIWLNILY